ncbi:hypothetical protein [Streptomyces prasinopilosus]|uniref:hypothetical protein n=1 Tax=Streptomyces prasinopilosus TaxID=67344 RepID=UPI00099EE67D|nr:hypothetical protein [Streptomyces prasinopilosus]
MDPQIVALAGTAGTTIVGLMVTDVWQRTRDGVIALWRRAQPERAETVTLQLEETRSLALAAREDGDEATESELQAEWQGRIRRLLAAHPAVADELQALLDELKSSVDTSDQNTIQRLHMRANATGHGRVYQAGRDQNITES